MDCFEFNQFSNNFMVMYHLVVSLFVVVAALQISALLSFVAFIVMVVAGVFLERELTARGRDQLSRIPEELRRRAARGAGPRPR